MVVVHVGNIQDRDGAKLVLEKTKSLFPSLKLIWADGGYAGKLVEWVLSSCAFVLEIVKRNADIAGFYVLPRRWVVERTFGWFAKYRRLRAYLRSLCQRGLVTNAQKMIQKEW